MYNGLCVDFGTPTLQRPSLAILLVAICIKWMHLICCTVAQLYAQWNHKLAVCMENKLKYHNCAPTKNTNKVGLIIVLLFPALDTFIIGFEIICNLFTSLILFFY